MIGKIITNTVVSALAVFATAYLLSGVTVDGFLTALIVALVLGIINAILKPILLILTLPINILTLGLFTFVINAALVLLASHLISGFAVAGFFWALLFSFVVSVINSLLGSLLK
ncbi:phage holin family protein [Candidatus Beckwithbacteria bacterium]|nr:phage holin family protein [Candidatus Beckwithbacteria bacterium]